MTLTAASSNATQIGAPGHDGEPPGAAAGPPAGRRVWRVPAGVRDVLLVVLGAGLAYAADAWRDAQAERRRTAYAVASIRAELAENLARVERARTGHLRMADTLGAYQARRQLPPERVYFGGVFVPAHVLSTAWQTARETGATGGLPYPVLLALAPVYENQEGYRALGAALAQTAMADMQRRGALPVFRDGFANFIPLERDFAVREEVLARGYRQALARLDSVAPPGR
jgi:hypothetical protein